ncbi:hypothetical protein [Clostridium isatidis]|uniref:Uncharacterized protein n=1 Tax=Clostridium isatidis TaxID=182773 RepID=A0A343JAG4_9CLOT|nr:hypothetical protein [Clostridium isatidis]ASW42522.1 hypothetical protein BEN51_03220 [Clostridium isatidis]
MKYKSGKVISIIVIVFLLVAIGILIRNILNKENKEITVAEDFIEELYDKDIISSYKNKKDTSQDISLNKLASENSQIKYSVIVGNFGVDIDENYEVLGFSNKNIRVLGSEDIISEEDAKKLANGYVSEITKDNFIFKEVRNTEEKSPYYTVVFYECKDSYPIFNQEIIALIDKVSGKLEGYSNYSIANKEIINKIDIKEEKAKEIAVNHFRKLNIDVHKINNIFLSYIENDNNELVLSYVFNVTGNKNDIVNSNTQDNGEKLEKSFTVFVRADTGEIINLNLET